MNYKKLAEQTRQIRTSVQQLLGDMSGNFDDLPKAAQRAIVALDDADENLYDAAEHFDSASIGR